MNGICQSKDKIKLSHHAKIQNYVQKENYIQQENTITKNSLRKGCFRKIFKQQDYRELIHIGTTKQKVARGCL
jgi:hypothetical protein